MPLLTRRRVLAGGALVLAGAGGVLGGVEAGALPGKIALDSALGACDVDAAPRSRTSPPVLTSSFVSKARGRRVGVAIARPPGHALAGLPVVLVLPGLNGVATTGFGSLGLHLFLADHVRAGGRPMALVGIDGGDTYYHPRRVGSRTDDSLAMIGGELLPRLAGLKLDTTRVGALGWSMGGFGALLLARESGKASVHGVHLRAVAAASPALFASAGSTAPGSFDDAADWAKWGDLARHPGIAKGVAVRADCGSTDAFTATTRTYLRNAGKLATGSITAGCHEAGYWRSRARTQLAFLGRHLG